MLAAHPSTGYKVLNGSICHNLVGSRPGQARPGQARPGQARSRGHSPPANRAARPGWPCWHSYRVINARDKSSGVLDQKKTRRPEEDQQSSSPAVYQVRSPAAEQPSSPAAWEQPAGWPVSPAINAPFAASPSRATAGMPRTIPGTWPGAPQGSQGHPRGIQPKVCFQSLERSLWSIRVILGDHSPPPSHPR